KALEKCISDATLVIKSLPDGLLQRLKHFRSHGTKNGLILIRGLPIQDDLLGPTPPHWSHATESRTYYGPELLLLGITSVIGEPFAFDSQNNGDLVQNIVPIREHSEQQTGTGSSVF